MKKIVIEVRMLDNINNDDLKEKLFGILDVPHFIINDIAIQDIQKDCNNCQNATNDLNNELDNGCYLCSKDMENNFVPLQTNN